MEAGEKRGIFPVDADGLSDSGRLSPEGDGGPTALRKVESEGGAPGGSAHDGDVAQACVAPGLVRGLPKRYSVPLRSREMFWRCLAMAMMGTIKMTATSQGL